MKNLIERIMIIDRNAKAKLDDAVRHKEEAVHAIDARKQQMNADLEGKAQQHLADVDKTEAIAAAEAVTALELRIHAEQTRLQQVSDEHHNQWVEDLIAGILPEQA